MRKYSNNTKYVIYQNIHTEHYYAVAIAEVIKLDIHHSDMDNFLYAPEDLSVDCIPVSFNRNNGMIDFENNKIRINVHNLKKQSITISD